MPPNKPPHKRQKSSILNPGGFHFVEDKQDTQPQLPAFNIPVQQQPQPQPSSSSYTNLDPSSLITQGSFPTHTNRLEEQDVYNYAYESQPLPTNVGFRQGLQQQRGQYLYNQEFQGHVVGQTLAQAQAQTQAQTREQAQAQPQGSSSRRVASTGYDRHIEHPLASPPAPPSATSTSFNYQQGGPYQSSPNQPTYYHQQQRQQQRQQQQQQRQVRSIPNPSQQPYYTDTNYQRPYQQSSSQNPLIGGSFAFNPALSQLSPAYPTIDTNYSNPQQQASYNINPATGGNKQYPPQQPIFSGGSLQPSIQASSITSGPPSIPASVVTTAPTPVPVPIAAATAQAAAPRHQKNALSISSHLTSISLGSGGDAQENIPTSDHPRRFHRNNNSLLDDLLLGLFTVDGNNMGSYLHSMICKINTQFPLDDFYNLLYNNDRQILLNAANFNYNQKIDKTPIALHSHDSAASIMNQVLEVFKNPAILVDFIPNHDDDDGSNKLFSINYHELLRTFLAIKILNDMMIEVPLNMAEDPLTYSIPRLSIFKTYFIICQKLITRYPSSSNTANEQQKLILGQSKLGKLIKMVYPNLPIKRLGSRGESRYHYLGVVWNEHIIDNNIKQLCDQHDLTKLNEMFSEGNVELNELLFAEGLPTDAHSQIRAISTGVTTRRQGRKRSRSSAKEKQMVGSRGSDVHSSQTVSPPQMSFVKMDLMFPLESNFTVLSDEGRENWFTKLLTDIYSKALVIDRNLIKFILLTNSNLTEKSNLLNSLLKSVFNPLVIQEQTIINLDLHLYAIIILEVLPYLLLIKSSADINMVTNLRLNLLHLINNIPQEILKLNSSLFPLENVSKFLNLVKKLINLNDLLITFIKLLNKQELNSMMARDIENFLDVKSTDFSVQEGDDYLGNLMSGVGGDGASSLTNVGDGRFNFKNDILSNDLIQTLVGFRYDPNTASDLKRLISVNSINEEVALLDEFFKIDLLKFLTGEYGEKTQPLESSSLLRAQEVGTIVGELVPSAPLQSSTQPLQNVAQLVTPIGQPIDAKEPPSSSNTNTVLNPHELTKLKSLLALIDTKSLSQHIKSKYPIQLYNNFITFILNDILKHIFLKQQQQQQQRSQVESMEEGSSSTQNRVSLNPNSSENSFGSWWVFNSIIQEYLSLLGEIVGLKDLILK